MILNEYSRTEKVVNKSIFRYWRGQGDAQIQKDEQHDEGKPCRSGQGKRRCSNLCDVFEQPPHAVPKILSLVT